MAVDIFSTRAMLEVVEHLPRPKSFLLDTFFRNEETFESEEVDIDLKVGARRKAAYVSREGQGQSVDQVGFFVDKYKPPYISLTTPFTVRDLQKRDAGEHIYGGKSIQQRAVERIAKQMQDFNEMIVRAEEEQAKQALFDAQIVVNDINGNPTGDTVSFERHSELAIGTSGLVGGVWSNATNAKPWDDFDLAQRRISQHGRVRADHAVLGSDAWRHLRDSDQFQRQLDTRRIEGNEMITRFEASGAVYRGKLDNGIMLFTYDEWAIDETATGRPEAAIVPSKKVLVGSSEAKGSRLYGLIEYVGEDDKPEFFAVPRFSDSWVQKNPDKRMVRMQSAPLMVTHQPNGYAVLTVAA